MFKKIISIGLVVMMVLSVMMVGVANVSAERYDEFTDSDGINWICFEYEDGWEITPQDGSYIGESVNIPDSIDGFPVRKIRECAFCDNTNLKSVVIPDSVTSIGVIAFQNCSNLTDVTFGASLKTIENSAFYSCSNLKHINIPDSVETIGETAFAWCFNLESINIGKSVSSIGYDAFYDTPKCTSITVNRNNTAYDSRNNCNSIIETSTNTLIKGCNTSVIPNSVTSIGYAAFYDSRDLESIIIPNSITTIGDYAFARCSALTSISIPESVNSVGRAAFIWCESLSNATIPNSITVIEDETFSICPSLTNVIIPNSITSIGYSAFKGCTSFDNITIPESVTNIGDKAFGYIFNMNNGMSALTTVHTNIYTSNQVAIDYLLNNNFHHSILGDYYVNYTEEPPLADNDIRLSGRTGKSKLTVSIDASNLRVTVPTVLPVSVDADNNVTVSDNAQISNLSNGQVDVTGCTLSGQNEWSIVPFSTDFTKVPVNTKQYGFKLKNTVAQDNGTIALDNFDTIDGSDSMVLPYDANVAIQSEAINGSDIGRIVFTVAWHK